MSAAVQCERSTSRRLTLLAPLLLIVLCMLMLRMSSSVNPPPRTLEPRPTSMPVAKKLEPNSLVILYVYTESPTARANILFFAQNGLHDAVDVVFILNGPTDVEASLPKLPSVKVLQRGNSCFNTGTWGTILAHDDHFIVNKYKHFILMSSAIRGPYLPYWNRQCWTDAYTSRLKDQIKVRFSSHLLLTATFKN